MKILHVAQFLGIGGLEKIILHLVTEQIKQGHEVTVYIYDWEQAWVPFFRESGIKVITPPLKNPGYDLKLLRRLHKESNNYDIVHTHDLNPLMYMGPINLWNKISGKKRSKLIHTTHGLDHLENYPRSTFYEKRVSPLADAIVGVSQNVCDFYVQSVGISSQKVHRIDNGVNIYNSKITPELKLEKKREVCQRYQLNVNKPLLINVARVVPLKDQQFLMSAMKQCPDYQLLIVGPSGDESYYQKLENSQTENCRLSGPRSDIDDHLLAADLFVSASTHEGIPVAVLEAMGVKTPCLASDIPGHTIINSLAPSSVEIFKLGNLQNYKENLIKILSDQQGMRELSLKGFNAVKKHYSVTKMNSNYVSIYKDLLC